MFAKTWKPFKNRKTCSILNGSFSPVSQLIWTKMIAKWSWASEVLFLNIINFDMPHSRTPSFKMLSKKSDPHLDHFFLTTSQPPGWKCNLIWVLFLEKAIVPITTAHPGSYQFWLRSEQKYRFPSPAAAPSDLQTGLPWGRRLVRRRTKMFACVAHFILQTHHFSLKNHVIFAPAAHFYH